MSRRSQLRRGLQQRAERGSARSSDPRRAAEWNGVFRVKGKPVLEILLGVSARTVKRETLNGDGRSGDMANDDSQNPMPPLRIQPKLRQGKIP